jgi:hypothetical protein
LLEFIPIVYAAYATWDWLATGITLWTGFAVKALRGMMFKPVSRRLRERVPPVMCASSGSSMKLSTSMVPVFRWVLISVMRAWIPRAPSWGWDISEVLAQGVPPCPFRRKAEEKRLQGISTFFRLEIVRLIM